MKRFIWAAAVGCILSCAATSDARAQFGYGYGGFGPGFAYGGIRYDSGFGIGTGPTVGLGPSVGVRHVPLAGAYGVGYRSPFERSVYGRTWNSGIYVARPPVAVIPSRAPYYRSNFGQRCW